MQLGVCVASKIDDIDYVVEAERLGFTHAWFADSQMIWSDVYATMALAADRTTTIQVGTGVAVAATRPAPVTASAMATINQLAPGRTFCGIGTGNTAMRIMGHKPMTIAEFDRYLGELRPLLRGEESLVTWRGHTSPVRHIMADDGFVNFADPMPLYVSGFGPKSLALAGKTRRRVGALGTLLMRRSPSGPGAPLNEAQQAPGEPLTVRASRQPRSTRLLCSNQARQSIPNAADTCVEPSPSPACTTRTTSGETSAGSAPIRLSSTCGTTTSPCSKVSPRKSDINVFMPDTTVG